MKMKIIFSALFALSIVTVSASSSSSSSASSSAPRTTNNNNSVGGDGKKVVSVCEMILDDWLQSLKPKVNQSNASLKVDWSELDKNLSLNGCPFDNLWIELWVVKKEARERSADFGSKSFWHQYERCSKLIPEDFDYHSTRSHSLKTKESSLFYHIIEKEYMLRLCPCGWSKRRQTTVTDDWNPHVCECEYSNSTHCSQVLEMRQTRGIVYNWCEEDEQQRKQGEDSEKRKLVSIDRAEEKNCSSIQLTGTLASCTPIQTYDQVLITLHPINMSEDVCKPHLNHAGEPLKGRVKLIGTQPVNSSRGVFTYIAKDLATQYKYCVQIELVDHPYCNREYVINQRLGGSIPPVVCVNHLSEPVSLYKLGCREPDLSEDGSSSSDLSKIWPRILVISLVLVVLLCSAASFFFIRHKGNHKKNGNLLILDHRLMTTAPSTGGAKQAQITPPPDVFLLYFPESESFVDLNKSLRSWLLSLGCSHVYDLNDEQYQEAIFSDGEIWAENIISRSNTKVIIINSTRAEKAFTINMSNNNANGGGRGEDNNSDDHSLSATSSLLQQQPSGGNGDGSEDDVEDNLNDLRISSLRYIRAHHSGNYKKLSVISYGGGSSNGNGGNFGTATCNHVLKFTPQRLFSLPEHLGAVRAWVVSSSSSSAAIFPPTQVGGVTGTTTVTTTSVSSNSSVEQNFRQKIQAYLNLRLKNC